MFGLNLRSQIRLGSLNEESSGGAPGVELVLAEGAQCAAEQRVLASRELAGYEGPIQFQVLRRNGLTVLKLGALAEFTFSGRQIECRPGPAWRPSAAEHHILSSVLAFWLEQSGRPVLHGSAVMVKGAAIAFVGRTGSGKSTLAAAFAGAGHCVLSDDLVTLDARAPACTIQPAYPFLRLRPDAAACFHPRPDELPLVHPRVAKRRLMLERSRFRNESAPLRGIFVLNRDPPTADAKRGVRTAELSGMDGLVELIRHSYMPHTVEAAGLQPRRISVLASVAESIPFVRLEYSADLRQVARLRDAVLEHAGKACQAAVS